MPVALGTRRQQDKAGQEKARRLSVKRAYDHLANRAALQPTPLPCLVPLELLRVELVHRDVASRSLDVPLIIIFCDRFPVSVGQRKWGVVRRARICWYIVYVRKATRDKHVEPS